MTKKIVAIALASTALLLVACGGSSSSDSFSGTYTTNGVTYSCPSKAAYDACTINNDCSSCTNNAPAPSATPEISECATSGNTVLVDEGTTCTNGSSTLSCSGNKVTLDGSITATKITINGKVYTCQ